ncbi:MAG: hypothetical protein ACREEV_07680, partial [Dongiaceae bacterium]
MALPRRVVALSWLAGTIFGMIDSRRVAATRHEGVKRERARCRRWEIDCSVGSGSFQLFRAAERGPKSRIAPAPTNGHGGRILCLPAPTHAEIPAMTSAEPIAAADQSPEAASTD